MENEITVKDWLEYARLDRDTALHLLENMFPPPLDIICFHCQQSAEKHLKALLSARKIEFEKSHNLLYLTKLQSNQSVTPANVLTACSELNSYSVVSRYPGGGQATLKETKKAVKNLNAVVAWVLKEFKKMEREDKAVARASKKSRSAAKNSPSRSD